MIVVLRVLVVWYDFCPACFSCVVVLLSCVFWWCGMIVFLCVLVVWCYCCPVYFRGVV